MFVASLGMCMLLFAEMYLTRNGLSAEGLAMELEFEMDERHTRLVRLAGKLRAPKAELGERARALVRAALACPVHKSIREDVEVSLELAG
jgi:uncharacterized OsmC-like protein